MSFEFGLLWHGDGSTVVVSVSGSTAAKVEDRARGVAAKLSDGASVRSLKELLGR